MKRPVEQTILRMVNKDFKPPAYLKSEEPKNPYRRNSSDAQPVDNKFIHPSQVPSKFFWFSADRGVYKDTARTQAATAQNDLIKGWSDYSGLGNHATQSSSSLAGIYAPTDVNSLYPAVQFVSGGGRYMDTSAITKAQPFMSVLVMKVRANGTGNFWQSVTGSDSLGTPSQNQIDFNDLTGTMSNTNADYNNWHVQSVIADAAATRLFTDYANYSTLTFATMTTTGFVNEQIRIGNGDIDIAEMVFAQTTQEIIRQGLVAYFKQKYGI